MQGSQRNDDLLPSVRYELRVRRMAIDWNKYFIVERALSPDTVQKFGLKPNSHSVEIPIFEGDLQVASKVYTPATKDQPKKIAWSKSLDGKTPPMFPSNDVAENARYIVEGEFDAMLATQELGEPVVSPTTGAKGWSEHWSPLFKGRHVTILYDAHDGDEGAVKTAASIRKAGGYPSIAKWPDDKPKGYDVTDFFREGGEREVFRAILDSAVAFVPPGLANNSVEFLAMDIKPPQYLINQVWPEEGIGFVAGPPKAFKSFLTLEMAFSIATGQPFLGRFEVPAERRVLVVQQESSLGAFQVRVANCARRFGESYNLYILSNKSLSLEDEAQIERLEAEIERIRPALVILDPLASFISGDENSASEMGEVIRLLRRLRDTYRTGFAVVHHSTKGNGKVSTDRGGMRMRGSSAFYAAAEAGIWVDRVDDESLRSKVRFELKESEAADQITVEMDPDTTALTIGTAEPIGKVIADINQLNREYKQEYLYPGEEDERGWN